MSTQGTSHPSVQRYARHVNPAFVKLLGALGHARVFVRARGTRVWDDQEREYVDFLAASGTVNLGHNPPRLLAKLRDALSDDAINLIHMGPQVYAGDCAEALTAKTGPLSMCLFANTGGEAIESAMKLARAATKRAGILYCKGGVHGTGLGPLSIMGSGRMRDPFEPLIPDCFEIPFGNLDALETALRERKIAGFVVEPIQAEAGVILAPRYYLKDAADLCKRHGTLLVLDEVQTGLGRCGTMFAYEAEDFVPDVLVVGTALGGGVVPISAALTTPELHHRAFGSMDKFDLHGSTFSGNAFACRAALETLAILDEEQLAAASAERGERLLTSLQARLDGHPLVREVRGRGLLVAIELGSPEAAGGWLSRLSAGVMEQVSRRIFAQWLAVRLLEHGVLAQPASQQWNVLRLEPPLIVTDDEIDDVISTIGEILDEYREVGPLLRDAGERLGKQLVGGWTF